MNREVTSRVQVPVAALMTGTPSRTARESAVRRSLKEAVSKLLARGTRIAYEASSWWARGQKDSKPDVIRTGAAYMRRVYGRKVTRLTLRGLSSCYMLVTLQSVAMGRQKSAEVIVTTGVRS